MNATVKCPICGRPVAWVAAEEFRPFCSERCKLVDLGAWASAAYVIADESDGAADFDEETDARPECR